MMQRIPLFTGLLWVVALFSISAPAFAGTLQWDRNTEADMDHYNVYACLVRACVVLQNAASKLPTAIIQPAVGIVPSSPLPTGEGAIAVSAVDRSGNESGLSVSVPFDAKAPGVPVNPRIQ